MSLQPLPYPDTYDIDVEAEWADRRYREALDRITVFDVISTACDLLSQMPDLYQHPLYRLAAHVLRRGSYKRSGKPAHMSDWLGRKMEDLLDEAVERCIAEQLLFDERADRAMDAE